MTGQEGVGPSLVALRESDEQVDRPEEGQSDLLGIQSLAEVAGGDQGAEEVGLEGQGPGDEVVVVAGGGVGLAVLLDGQEATQERELGVVEDDVEHAAGDRQQRLLARGLVGGGCVGARGGSRAEVGGRRVQALVGPLDEGVENGLLGGEVLVDRARPDADRPGEVADRGVAEPLAGELGEGGVQQGFAGVPGGAACAGGRAAGAPVPDG